MTESIEQKIALPNKYPVYIPSNLGNPEKPQGYDDRSSGSLESAVEISCSDSQYSDDRERWEGRFSFILSLIGFSVGLGNIWRFPYLCYKNGGGAFLIPYFICLVCAGIPLFFMELALGQFMSKGGIAAWNICPLFQGIGYASTVVVFWLNAYYIIVLTWAVYYLYLSVTSIFGTVPWTYCDVAWASAKCFDGSETFVNTSRNSSELVSPAEDFFSRYVLNSSDTIEDVGGLRFGLVISLIVSWFLIYLCIWKGVKVTGKIVWFTALFPYVILFSLFVRGVTLDGAWDGIEFYLKPNLTRLADAEVWIDAGTQIFFSYSIGIGGLVALGSYNVYNNNCLRDAVIFTSVNTFTSIFGGVAIFSVLGYMAKDMGVEVGDVAAKGPGLVFVAYPKAITTIPGAPIWSSLFFLMILILGVDSEFVGVEGFVTSIMDWMPHLFKYKHSREFFVGATCVFQGVMGLSMITRGGIFVFELFDYYSASGICLLLIATFECVSIGWFYGANRFCDDIKSMVGRRPPMYFPICWALITPLTTVSILVYSVYEHTTLKLNNYTYPIWAYAFGYFLAFSSVSCIPITAFIKYVFASGSVTERFFALITPTISQNQIHENTKEPYNVKSTSSSNNPIMKTKSETCSNGKFPVEVHIDYSSAV